MEIREIKIGTPDYIQAINLRRDVLRTPLGLQLTDKDTSTDAVDIHIGAFENGKIIGVLSLRRNGHHRVQMRQVAISPDTQGRGVGRALVHAFEARAHSIGAHEILMDARVSARVFYEKLGYTATSADYIQSTIPHVKMHKRL